MKIQLILNGEDVELTKDVEFPITKQFENLQIPTNIINDWTKTVSIPFSIKNNLIFKHIFRTDYVINSFDPTKKIPMMLIYNGEVIMEGYAKLTSIKKSGQAGTYELNLFGKLGEIFNELMKISPNITDEVYESSDYYIGDYFKTTMNKDLIINAWKNKPSLSTAFNSQNIYNNIGFAPINAGYNDDFNSKSYEHVDNEGKSEELSFEDTLSDDIYENVGIEKTTVIGDGMLPRQFGEYRSYYQLPYIHVPRLFDILKQKCKQLTDYELVINKKWANNKNPYWKDLVMTLKTADRTKSIYHNYYNIGFSGTLYWDRNKLSTSHYMPFTVGDYRVLDTDDKIKKNNTTGEYFIELTDDVVSLSTDLHLYIKLKPEYTSNIKFRFGENNYLKIDIGAAALDSNNIIYNTKKTIIVISEKNNTTFPDEYEIYKYNRMDTDSYGYYSIKIDTNYTTLLDKNSVKEKPRIILKAEWANNNTALTNSVYGDVLKFVTLICTNDTSKETTNSLLNIYQNTRSNSIFKLDYIWDSNNNFFEQILKYTKMMNLIWTCDTKNKQIKLESFSDFFSKYTITDWTNKVDYSKEFNISPIIYDNCYYKFNYNDTDDSLNKFYNENHGCNFGELKLKTNYDFNSDTTDYFKDITPSLESTENILGWNHMYSGNITFVNLNEPMPHFADTDNKKTDTFGAFYFYNGLRKFDTNEYANIPMRSVRVTDDTLFQVTNQKFMYTDNIENADYQRVTQYPELNIINKAGTHLCVFNTPSTSFVSGAYYNKAKNLYTSIWKNVVENERLNKNLHKITAYVNLTPIDYKNFNFYNLVTINTQLYFVNKISDYNFNDISTKVELIKINDLENFIHNDLAEYLTQFDIYIYDLFIPHQTTEWIKIGTYDSYNELTFNNGLKTITASVIGVQFKLENDEIYYKAYETYTKENDAEYELEFTDGTNIKTVTITRYSLYPYPFIEVVNKSSKIDYLTGTTNTVKIRWVGVDKPETEPTLYINNEKIQIEKTTNVYTIDNLKYTFNQWEHSKDQDVIFWGDDNETFYHEQWEIQCTIERVNGDYKEKTIKINIHDNDYNVENEKTITYRPYNSVIDASSLNNYFIDYHEFKTKKYMGTIIDNTNVTFGDGTSTLSLSSLNLTLYIENNKVYYTSTSYVEPTDKEYTVAVKDATGSSTSFKITRYSQYPYPTLTCDNTTQTASSGKITLKWTGTYGEKDPSVSFGTPTGVTLSNKTITKTDCMISDDDGDEYFMNEFVITYDYVRTNTRNELVSIKVVDEIGTYGSVTITFSNIQDKLDLSTYKTTYNSTIKGKYKLCDIYTISQAKFDNNTTTYTVDNQTFTIENNVLYVNFTKYYVGSSDRTTEVTIKNASNLTVTFTLLQYAVFPYPKIQFENEDGKVITNIIIKDSTKIYVRLLYYNDYVCENSKQPTITFDKISSISASYSDANWELDNDCEYWYIDGDYEHNYWSSWKLPVTIKTVGNRNNILTANCTTAEGYVIKGTLIAKNIDAPIIQDFDDIIEIKTFGTLNDGRKLTSVDTVVITDIGGEYTFENGTSTTKTDLTGINVNLTDIEDEQALVVTAYNNISVSDSPLKAYRINPKSIAQAPGRFDGDTSVTPNDGGDYIIVNDTRYYIL